MTTGLLHHPHFLEHVPGPHHPERPARYAAVMERLRESGLLAHLEVREARPLEPERTRLVHTAEHLERVRAACERAPIALDGDTAVSAGSWDAALCAAGGLVEACERVVEGSWSRAFCAVRPPGHHAEADRAMGFCLFNSVAIAAAHLRESGLERVAILDWDVHHGNGTQHIFERDPSVMYLSMHQWPLYPGTGAESERGLGEGEGATLNCPRPAGAEDADWLEAFEGQVLPALEGFRPEFVLVSAGFDAHRHDPLAGTSLSEDAYRRMTAGLLRFTEAQCGGRLVTVLEGGYHLGALADCVEAHVGALVEEPA